jgi:hypothetical protein
VWIITHGCASRSISLDAGNSQQQIIFEILVPGQSVGWEECSLMMRHADARQVSPSKCS